MADFKGKSKIGIIKVRLKLQRERKVKIVVSQTSFGVCFALPFSISASSTICKPTASNSPSAIAIIIIPLTTTNFEEVAEYSPTIIPRLVITAEVRPKEIPVTNW